jgi:hypothetical protein
MGRLISLSYVRSDHERSLLFEKKNWFQVSPKQRLFWHCSQTDNENGRTQIDSEHVVQVRPCAPSHSDDTQSVYFN